MKNLKYKELMILNSILNQRSLSSVADYYGISQSTLSKMISSIENQLGSKILNRDYRPLRITDFGKSITPALNDCIHRFEYFEKSIASFQENGIGNVTVYSSGAIQSILVSFVLPMIHLNNPNIRISMKTKPQKKNEYIDGIYFEDDCDILISYNIPKNQNLIAKKITTVNLNVFSTDDFYEKYPFSEIDELIHHPFVLQSYMSTNDFKNTIKVIDTRTDIISELEMKGNYMFDNNQQAIQYSSQGMGYVLSSNLSTADYIDLKPRLPKHLIIPLGIYVICREKTYQTNQVKKIYSDIISGLHQLQRRF